MKYFLSFLIALIICLNVKAQDNADQQAAIPSEQSKTDTVLHEILFETTKGNIRFILYNETPLHRDAFMKHVQDGFYDGTLFHRVIFGFMIQGGDPNSRNAEPGWLLGEGEDPNMERIPAEIVFPKYHHRRGVLAAAREDESTNPELKSSNCQFYFVWGKRYSEADMSDVFYRNKLGYGKLSEEEREYFRGFYQKTPGTPWLDGAYTVFGEIIEGFDVVNAIQLSSTDKNDRPIEDIKIIKATVVK